MYAFVATQADKLGDASGAMLDLLDNMAKADIQFEAAKEAIQAKIETERITKENIFWTYLNNKDRGIDYDLRKETYDYSKTVTIDEFEKFFNEYIAGNKYKYLIIGNRDLVDMKKMKKLGKVKELTLEELFNY